MNSYQREKIVDLPSDASEYLTCCGKEVEELDEVYLAAVKEGNIEKIKEYLESDKDVNAEHAGDSILSRACALGKVEVVEMVLQKPEVHLNKNLDKRTPIAKAAEKGHLECVKAILDAKLKCRPVLKKAWKAVHSILKKDEEICHTTLLHIMGWAIHGCQWEIVRLILKMNVQIPQKMMYQLVMLAVDRSQWDLAKEALQKKFSGRQELLLEILCLNVYHRRWELVDEVLHMIDENLVMDKKLVEAALGEDYDAARKLVEKKKIKATEISASFLVVAAAGTTETMAELFLGAKSLYSRTTFADALFLAAMGQHSEYLCPLLILEEASLSFHDMTRAHRMLEIVCVDEAPNRSLINFFDYVMEMKAKTINGKR